MAAAGDHETGEGNESSDSEHRRHHEDTGQLSLCHNETSGGIHLALIYVTVQPNESIDSALKRFNMKLQQSGLLRQLKEHAHYEKPSEKRRRMKRRRQSRQ